jgi:hypothetical protein
MAETEPSVNNTLEKLKGEITTILTDKDASDSVVNKLSNVFKDLAIYKDLQAEIDVLNKQNNDLLSEVEKIKNNEQDLTEKLKNLLIEKNTLLEQLSNWRENTTHIMSANVHLLNGLVPNAKKPEDSDKPQDSSAGTHKEIDSEGNIQLVVQKDEKKRGVHTLQDIKEEGN